MLTIRYLAEFVPLHKVAARQSGTFISQPVLLKQSGTFVEKTVKIKSSGTFA